VGPIGTLRRPPRRKDVNELAGTVDLDAQRQQAPARAVKFAMAALRAVLLAVLLIGGAAAIVTENAAVPSDLQTLLHDVHAGRVNWIVYSSGVTQSEEIRWSTGPLTWWQARYDGSSIDVAAVLRTEARRAGQPAPSIRMVYGSRDVGSQRRPSMWGAALPWGSAATAVVLAWVVTFFAMIVQPAAYPRRYASGWCWFWLFVVGGIGPVLYLWLEPHPFWLPGVGRREESPHRRALFTGTQGFVAALLVALALQLVPLGVNKALGRTPRRAVTLVAGVRGNSY